ncbi:protease SohB [Legionella israelensis]|uniref:Protease SohB n=1 Tax=Legionella israelensis TaxID=454 RepID=A0A0W0WHX5_9GAMM|nr:protease SohB [Legionella israelensis]KTD31930.1 signal peptide peptidase SppA [Legionella israelensis]QBR83869.1 protease SohB [Legionella israelensis]QBS10750.1 protease SohB [Legionella israelensis]SCY28134.1 inner membrane peptidase. Serine peptidase. MEROPS family S49 [Legionella israelensis DSM 19235]STX57718.1 signal peptide peptidase SppA [Legionella israelensis]
MEFLSQYSLFLLKSITIVIAVLAVVGGIFSMSRKKSKQDLQVINLSEKYENNKQSLAKEIHGHKAKKKKDKSKRHRTLYVIEFSGDIKASQVEQLRDEISAVLSVACSDDEVVIKLDSPGGAVNGYGLAASQLQRIRDKNIPLTVCIDKMAASGGYLMACVADQIVAAPFAIIGSIGVVAQIPNFYRWLQKNHIDIELMTAGEYKRTLTLFAENTEKGRKKFQEELEQIHQTFRDYVHHHREQLDIDKVSTGEHWLAKDAFQLSLVDKLSTSDDYIIQKMDEFKAFEIKIEAKPSLINKLLKPAMNLLHPWG